MCKLFLVSLMLSSGAPVFAQDAPRPAGWVVLPVSEYSALHARAYPASRAPEPAAVDATLTRVDYDLRLENGVAVGQATLTVDVLKDGWVRVPIPAGLLVSSATMGGNPVTLAPSAAGSPQLSALLSRRGRANLMLEVVLPATSAAGEQNIAVPATGSGITRASLTVPSADLEVTARGSVLTRGAPNQWIAYASGNAPVVFVFRRKKIETPAAELPLRTRGTLTQLFGLGEDSTSVNAEVEIEVVQGIARRARIALPANVAINHVPGGGVAEWDVKDGVLVVGFLEPAERSAKFGIIGEARLPRNGAVEIPLLKLLDVERQTGGTAVEVIGAGEIKSVQQQGFDPADATELGPMISARQSPALAAFRVRQDAADRQLRVDIARYTQQAVLTANIEEARHRALLTRDGKVLVQARYAVRNNQRNFLRIALPAGARLWSAAVGERPIRPGRAPDGSLLLPLAKSGAGEETALFAVEVIYLASGTAWTDKGRATVSLPTADLPVSRTGVTVHYPPLFRVTAEPGQLHAQAFEAPGSPVLTHPAASPAVELRRPPTAARPGVVLPQGVDFPAIGPSLYLASELTEENKAPAVEVIYQREKQGREK